MENNFKCNHCKNKFFISQYRVILKETEKEYCLQNMHKIQCPHCHGEDIEYIQGKVNYKSIHIGKFSSASPVEKRAMLKKRAHEHHIKHDQELVHHKNEQTEIKLKEKFLK
jgi:excinuclease UvrABC ATPase subunit